MGFRNLSQTNGTGTSVSAGQPSMQPGDVLTMVVYLDGGNFQAITWPAGFTQVLSTANLYPFSGPAGYIAAAQKFVGALVSEPANYLASWGVSANYVADVISHFGRGGLSTTLQATTGAAASGASPSLPLQGLNNPPGGDIIAVMGATSASIGGAGWTNPTGYVLQAVSGSGAMSTSVATKNNAATGPTGIVSGSVSGITADTLGMLLALPAADATVQPSSSDDYY